MKKINMLIGSILLLCTTSCQKYLSVEPRVQADIQTVDQLRALADNAAAGPMFATVYNDLSANVSDDTYIDPAVYQNNPSNYLITPATYTFDIKSIEDLSQDRYYNAIYKKIFTANVILANIDEVSGSQADKNQVKADAYFSRAEAYWCLANYYCQPYSSANLLGLGLSLKKSTDYAESVKRSTLRETYDFILSDINQAENLTIYTDVPAAFRFRVSKSAVEAFLSRYYLFTGDYASAISHANSALRSASVQLIDYNTIGAGTPANYTNPTVTLSYSALNSYSVAQMLSWGELYYDRFDQNLNQINVPSPALLSLYDQSNDLRYKLFMIPNGGRRFNVATPSVYRYTQFNDGRYFIIGPSIAEVLLNKAEAAARTGDWATAATTINLLRAKRYKTGSTYTLSFSSQADAITNVLQERRRELPFTFRFWDIRRYSVNNDPSDDVPTVTHSFFTINDGSVDQTTSRTYTLQSANYVIPINNIEIINSQGQIQQNTYK